MPQLVKDCGKALAELQKFSQEEIDAMCKECLQKFVKHGEEPARKAIEETGLSSVE